MAKNLLRNLSTRDLHVTIEHPEFAALVASELPGDFQDGDGFDDQANLVLSSLLEDQDTGAALDLDLAGAGFTPGEVAPALYGQAISDYNAVLSGGEGLVDILSTTSGTPSAPDCTPTLANPFPCGEGGGTGGGEAEQ